ncbi:MAG: hypothetical protein IPN62_10890 [Flavobacteriales bacterium]|nr:hypothetical protein [Flavobacteriales bacterium]
MRCSVRSLILLLSTYSMQGMAQSDSLMLSMDEHYVMGDAGEDPSPELHAYDHMNKALGADSVRLCGGVPCSGWVQDLYPDGVLKHRGHYQEGYLTLYRNYYSTGTLEREFRQVDAIRSLMRTYHPNGTLRSEARYVDGAIVSYQDNYVNGKLRYAEERDRKEGFFTRMDLFTAAGEPVSLFQLVDRKQLEFELKEYHPGGVLKTSGRARYDRSRMDTQRMGVWQHFGLDGAVVREDHYQDGKLASVK